MGLILDALTETQHNNNKYLKILSVMFVKPNFSFPLSYYIHNFWAQKLFLYVYSSCVFFCQEMERVCFCL